MVKKGQTGTGAGAGASAKTAAQMENPLLVGILFSIIIVFVTIMYFYIRNKKKGRSILIVGPSESGKTAIFLRLGFGKDMETVTSTTPNITEFEVPDTAVAPLLLKDLPGHEKVRVKYWDANKVGMRGVICVMDAAGGSKAVRDAAEVLYEILTDPIVNSVKPNILVFANKQDLPTAKATNVLRLQLEREITTLRLTKSASLKMIGGNSSGPTKALGKLDRDFEFNQLLPLKVGFAEGTAAGEEVEVAPIMAWLKQVA